MMNVNLRQRWGCDKVARYRTVPPKILDLNRRSRTKCTLKLRLTVKFLR